MLIKSRQHFKNLRFLHESDKIIIMKFYFLSAVCVIFFLVSPCLFLGAMEVELSVGADNMDINKLEGSNSIQSLPFVFGNLSAKGDITKNIGFKAAFARDAFMQNSVSGMVMANSDYLNVEFGPFIGITDKPAQVDFGVMGKMQLAYPGIVFLVFSGEASLGSQFVSSDSSDREKIEAAIGFWLPHVIPSFTFTSKNYTIYNEGSIEQNKLLRLRGSVDFFGKTFPITLRIDAGYEEIDFSHNDGSVETSGGLSAVFTGFEAKWRVAPQFIITAGFEVPIVFTATGAVKKPANNFELYKFNVGTVINL